MKNNSKSKPKTHLVVVVSLCLRLCRLLLKMHYGPAGTLRSACCNLVWVLCGPTKSYKSSLQKLPDELLHKETKDVTLLSFLWSFCFFLFGLW